MYGPSYSLNILLSSLQKGSPRYSPTISTLRVTLHRLAGPNNQAQQHLTTQGNKDMVVLNPATLSTAILSMDSIIPVSDPIIPSRMGNTCTPPNH